MLRDEAIGTTPQAIVQLGMAFCSAKVLLGAVELGLFTVLVEGAATEAELQERLGLHPRGSREFLNALVRLGLLRREDDRYANSPTADRYLVRGTPTYIGSFLQRADRVLYPAWGNFTDSLRTGESQIEGSGKDNMFTHLYQEQEQMRDFIAMMDALSGTLGPELAEIMDWSPYGSVVDVGGARGNLAALLVKAHPHLEAAVFDLPPVEAAFHEYMRELGLSDRVRFHGGDFFADPLPETDVLILGHVLEDWSPDRRRQLVRKAYDAIRPGGKLLVYDPMLDDERSPLVNLLTSLTMLVVTHGGSEYSIEECEGWMREAGFAGTEIHNLDSDDILIIAHKPA